MAAANFPAGFRSRRQRSGAVYFYFFPATGGKEVPLGKDVRAALEEYQVLQRKLLVATRPHGLSALDLLRQFEKCNPKPANRHATERQAHELMLLRAFFSEKENPLAHSIPDLLTYQQWLENRTDTRNFDSVRLFRRAWEFMRRHEYLTGTCPWTSVPSYSERVALELADILCSYSASELKRMLAQLLDPKGLDNTAFQPTFTAKSDQLGSDPFDDLRGQLANAKHAAAIALTSCQRDDLVAPLLKLTIDDLIRVLRSATRVRHLPPGRIDLTMPRKQVISRLRQQRAGETNESGYTAEDATCGINVAADSAAMP